MFFNINDMFGGMEQWDLIVYVGNQPIQQQQFQMPAPIAQAQFQQAMETIAREKSRQAMSVEMRRPADCPVGYYYIRFSNYDDEGVFDI